MGKEKPEEDLTRHETVDGTELRLTAVSHVLLGEIDHVVERRFRSEGRPIDPPTYQAVLAGGQTVEYPHDETTLEHPLEQALEEAGGDEEIAKQLVRERTLENKRLWALHKAAVAELEEAQNTERLEFLFSEGIDWDEEVPESWIAHVRDDWGFEVPTEPRELRIYYILRGLLKAACDQQAVMVKITKQTAQGVDESAVMGALDFFRPDVEGEDEADGPAGGSGPGALDEQPEVQGG